MTLLNSTLTAQELFDIAVDLQKQDRHIEAVNYFDAVLDKNPEYIGGINSIRFYSAWKAFKYCQDHSEWRHYDRLQRLVVSGLTQGHWFVGEATLAAPWLTNFGLLKFTREHAQFFLESIKDQERIEFTHTAPNLAKKIKLGFVGADFFAQATAYLLTGMIEALDRDIFDVYAYDHGEHIEDDVLRQRAFTAYDHIVSIGELSDVEVAQRIHDDGIDVLLSIKNPASARLGIFAMRPAAIQIHYLYFPGTSGMPFFDYIIADEVVIPKEFEYGYAEKVLRIDGCYQPNDDKRQLPIETSRDYWQLPEDAIVLANMSQNYKISPQIFDVWCRLLLKEQRRILWLLASDDDIETNLRREAESRGVDPARLYFSRPMGIEAHISRLRCADIVVDTYPYGGHTLTSDALWAGTPVVTLVGTTFASRVAASLLVSVGLTDLVANHQDEYFTKVDMLANDAERRRMYRQHLDEGRHQFELFSSTSYAKRFEKLMRQVVQQHWRIEPTE